jgi:hypothetical protein
MTDETRLMCGIILITIPSIQYGGYFLLRVLSGRYEKLQLNGFQKSMFRAGHAHAGVLVILSLVCQMLADYATLTVGLTWLTRAGIPASALLISGGFFASAIGKDTQVPNRWISLLYSGVFLLALSLVVLGIGLLN